MTDMNLNLNVILLTISISFIWTHVYGAPVITSTSYSNINDGLTSLDGDNIWISPCDTNICNTINLSYNKFISTNISMLNFRKPSDNYTVTYETFVKHLDLSHNEIIDPSLETIKNYQSQWTLISLDLSFNRISDMSSFPHLPIDTLHVLKLQNNFITSSVAITVFAWLYIDILEEINLENNNLTIIPVLAITHDPPAINPMTHTVNLKNNQLTQVELIAPPKCIICAIWYLETLHLEGNELDQTSFDLSYYYDSVTINLNNNKFTSLTSFESSDTFRLKYLFLNNNQIISVGSGSFDNFLLLEVLELANNQISSFPLTDINPKLMNLKTINLENNNLVNLDNIRSSLPSGHLTIKVKGKGQIT